MNISEFERNKPRKTRKAIEDLKQELESMLEFGKHNVDSMYMLDKIKNIETIFLSGE